MKKGESAGGWGSAVELYLKFDGWNKNSFYNANAAIAILNPMIGNCNLILIYLGVLTKLALCDVLWTGSVGVKEHSNRQQRVSEDQEDRPSTGSVH